jgi:hypothetical protein
MRPLKSHFRDDALTILKAVLTQLSAVCHCHQGSGQSYVYTCSGERDGQRSNTAERTR